MNPLNECQLPALPNMAQRRAAVEPQPFLRRLKRTMAVPWNYYGKKWLKQIHQAWSKRSGETSTQVAAMEFTPIVPIQTGDWVRVRSREEIKSTLNPFKELKGCAFLENMTPYCGSRQRVFKVMQRFLDERDYKVKKVNGVILLENVICQGTPAFGTCDRSCFLFWREEWLEKVEA
jgi:hypothetical protein